jgi:hypothetical protein
VSLQFQRRFAVADACNVDNRLLPEIDHSDAPRSPSRWTANPQQRPETLATSSRLPPRCALDILSKGKIETAYWTEDGLDERRPIMVVWLERKYANEN